MREEKISPLVRKQGLGFPRRKCLSSGSENNVQVYGFGIVRKAVFKSFMFKRSVSILFYLKQLLKIRL